MSKPMNVILLLIDSLNRHYLEPYGCDFVKTPHLQAFADEGMVMTRHFAGSLPCMPARREILAGVREFLWRGWGHVEAFDTLLPDYANARGYTTKLITDHYHYFEHAAHGYFESFQGYDLIRGQEIDAWKTERTDPLPAWIQKVEAFRPEFGKRYYRNVRNFQREEDWFTPQVFSTCSEWLRQNHTQPFFLFIDHFEVHEPFYCIEPYRSLYTDDPGETYNIWPPYQDEAASARFFAQTSDAELAYLRAQYWGKVTWVDTYLGRLMETMDALHLWDNTVFVITSDHGHDLAERHAGFGKQPPHHDSHAHLPLLIRHPAVAGGQQSSAVTSTVDLHATVREILGENAPKSAHSRSFLPALLGQSPTHRASTLCGTFKTGAMVADADHTYVHQPEGKTQTINTYSTYLPYHGDPVRLSAATSGRYLPYADVPVWRIPEPETVSADDHRLYRHSETNPNAEPNRVASEPEIADTMRRKLQATLTEDTCPPEQWERLGFA